MRTFSFLAALMLIFAACSRNSNTVVRLHADGLPPHTTPVLMTKDSIYTLRPDSMQSVKYTLPATFEPAYGALFLDNSHVLLYIEPGKSFDVSVQMKDGKLIPTFTGKGAAKNRYLNSDTLRYTPDYNLDEAAFIAALDDDFMKTYMVATIPRFILIDREGHIINAHMSRPSDPETEKCIEALKGL